MQKRKPKFDDYEEFKPFVDEAQRAHSLNKPRVKKDGIINATLSVPLSVGEIPDPDTPQN